MPYEALRRVVDQLRDEPSSPEKFLSLFAEAEKHAINADNAPEPTNSVHDNADMVKSLLGSARVYNGKLNVTKSTIPKAGSGLFTSEPIPSGRLIYCAEPLARHSYKLPCCDWCFAVPGKAQAERNGYVAHGLGPKTNVAELQACMGCREVKYCSKACQKKAWKAWHKTECKSPKPDPKMPSSRLFLRVLMAIESGAISADQLSQLKSLTNECFSAAAGPAPDPLFGNLPKQAEVYLEAAKSTLEPDAIANLCGRVATNMTEVSSAEASPVAIVVHPLTSMMNHSCYPNVIVTWNNGHIEVRASRAIAGGEELFIAYWSPQIWLLRRQSNLLIHWHFVCSCKKCEQEKLQLGTGQAGQAKSIRAYQREIDLKQTFYQLDAKSNKTNSVLDTVVKKLEQLSEDDEARDLDPMPFYYVQLSGLYLNVRNPGSALKMALRAFHATRTVRNHVYIHSLCLVVDILCNYPGLIEHCTDDHGGDGQCLRVDLVRDCKKCARDSFINDHGCLAIVGYAYIYFLLYECAHLLGARSPPSGTFRDIWSRFTIRCAGDKIVTGPEMAPKIAREPNGEYDRAFYKAQTKMLVWAGASASHEISLDFFADRACWL